MSASSNAFTALGVSPPIAAALAARGVTSPFPIQVATLPDALAGRDVLGRARTGSGKTIAFAIPIVQALAGPDHRPTSRRPAVLVLVPTRELAAQVARTVTPLAETMHLRCATVFGGVPYGAQITALRKGVDILVATPGRLEDLIKQGHCALDRVRATVLDEADLMADLGFLPAVRRLLDQTPSGQRLLFSATLDASVAGLAQRYLRDPVEHSIDPPEASPERADHHLFTVQRGHKAAVVSELAASSGRSLLFTRTKHGARKLARSLTDAGVPAAELHGNLTQRAREQNLAAFASGRVHVLVATDIAARGIHVDDIALVVHVDPPDDHKAYLHRSGRTARAGAAGAVVTIATPDQAGAVAALFRKAKVEPHAAKVEPGRAGTALRSDAARSAAPTPRTRAPRAKSGHPRRGQSHPSRRGQARRSART